MQMFISGMPYLGGFIERALDLSKGARFELVLVFFGVDFLVDKDLIERKIDVSLKLV
ncbi:hypothetical protein M23134_01855 [Microscilla marina ATCC 23134]|uniref:Uncharacterized protein n=1 Tax=Microscilla marina ATCC 23134 TaxID=313606 RepID=A1ZC24_MICM2|nr:hypothetical protein M23134_01855 [Microscilla marina ATCC 23134]